MTHFDKPVPDCLIAFDMSINKNEVKSIIEVEISKTQGIISELKEQVKPISPENAIGRISRMDAINNKSVVEASLRQNEDKLRKLELALASVDKPDFGICVQCKKPIPIGRIMLMPHAIRCVQCA